MRSLARGIVPLLLLGLCACSSQPAAVAPTTAPAPTAVSTPTSAAPTALPEATSAAGPTALPETTAAPLSFSNKLGSFTLKAPATRIVALSEEAADFLVTLGIQPIGFGSGRTSGTTNGQPFTAPHFFKAQLGTPTFVGSETTPSLELISTLKPDLIVSGSWAEEANQKLAQVAPTYVIDQSLPGYWNETLLEMGRLLGREAQAQQFLTDYDATAQRLAKELAPLAARAPKVLFIYSYAATDGTVLLGPGWTGSKPFALLGFNVLAPPGFDLSDGGAVPISPEVATQIEADIIFVIRIKTADGQVPHYPLDDLLASLHGPRVIYQETDATRGSTAPYTDRFVLKQIADLLKQGLQ